MYDSIIIVKRDIFDDDYSYVVELKIELRCDIISDDKYEPCLIRSGTCHVSFSNSLDERTEFNTNLNDREINMAKIVKALFHDLKTDDSIYFKRQFLAVTVNDIKIVNPEGEVLLVLEPLITSITKMNFKRKICKKNGFSGSKSKSLLLGFRRSRENSHTHR